MAFIISVPPASLTTIDNHVRLDRTRLIFSKPITPRLTVSNMIIIDKRTNTDTNNTDQHLQNQNSISRRAVLLSLLAVVTTFAVDGVYAAEPTADSQTNPVFAKGVKKGRLAGCKPDTQCISSAAAGSPDNYYAPWTFPETGDKARSQLLAYVEANRKTYEVMKNENNYIWIQFDGGSVMGKADIELLFRDGEKIVSIRAESRQTPKFYAFKGPTVNVKGALLDLRTALGWESLDKNLLFDIQ